MACVMSDFRCGQQTVRSDSRIGQGGNANECARVGCEMHSRRCKSQDQELQDVECSWSYCGRLRRVGLGRLCLCHMCTALCVCAMEEDHAEDTTFVDVGRCSHVTLTRLRRPRCARRHRTSDLRTLDYAARRAARPVPQLTRHWTYLSSRTVPHLVQPYPSATCSTALVPCSP